MGRISFLNFLSFLNPLEPLDPPLNQYLEVRQKPQKPLGEDGGRCPAVMLPLWPYKSELLTTKSEAYQHLH